jgi:DNA-binding transcriptional ArsR family regulator
VNLVVQYSGNADPALDRTFAALADPHRREILDRLGGGRVAASELAPPLGMTLTGVLKHVRALEEARLVTTSKEGRTRWCQLAFRPLDEAAAWIDERRRLWEHRLDSFERHVARLPAPETGPATETPATTDTDTDTETDTGTGTGTDEGNRP